MKEAAGETPAKRTLTAKIVVNESNAMMIVLLTVAIENAGMTVNKEAHPEILMMVSRTELSEIFRCSVAFIQQRSLFIC